MVMRLPRVVLTTTATLVWAIIQCHNVPSINAFFLAVVPSLSAGSSASSSVSSVSTMIRLSHPQHPAALFHFNNGARHTSIRPHYQYYYSPRTTLLSMAASPSFKSAAEPLLAAGKQLARLGEAWIDETRDTKQYGGPLSSAGANIRNAGDHVAQAAASCRFKTGTELIADELREAGTAIDAAADCLQQFVDETDKKEDRSSVTGESTTTMLLLGGLPIEPMIAPLRACGRSLEASGAAVLHRQPPHVVGYHLERAGIELKNNSIIATNNDNDVGGNGMILAGGNLQEKLPAPKTSSPNWMKQQQRL